MLGFFAVRFVLGGLLGATVSYVMTSQLAGAVPLWGMILLLILALAATFFLITVVANLLYPREGGLVAVGASVIWLIGLVPGALIQFIYWTSNHVTVVVTAS